MITLAIAHAATDGGEHHLLDEHEHLRGVAGLAASFAGDPVTCSTQQINQAGAGHHE
ncbi:MAG: hypothetical protein AB3X44_16425 [Leptothrix sp. (in: b-proteobacteria)]